MIGREINSLPLLRIVTKTHVVFRVFIKDSEIPALLNALAGRYTPPVPGGDLIRSPDILPTGHNIHADPFRMPTEFACRDGGSLAQNP